MIVGDLGELHILLYWSNYFVANTLKYSWIFIDTIIHDVKNVGNVGTIEQLYGIEIYRDVCRSSRWDCAYT